MHSFALCRYHDILVWVNCLFVREQAVNEKNNTTKCRLANGIPMLFRFIKTIIDAGQLVSFLCIRSLAKNKE